MTRIVVDNELNAYGECYKDGIGVYSNLIKINLERCKRDNQLKETLLHELGHFCLQGYPSKLDHEEICYFLEQYAETIVDTARKEEKRLIFY